jgi:4-hydroxyacetophenone monooxygenase
MKVNKEAIRGGAMLDYVLSPEDEASVHQKAINYLLVKQTSANGPLGVPTLDQAQDLMELFRGERLTPAETPLGYEELAFQTFPREVKWTKAPSPETLEAFRVVVVGGGINGISAAVNLERLGIQYTLVDRQADIGGTWMQNTYPEARVDTLGFSFQYKFESTYPWKEMYPSAPELRGYLDHVATKYGVKSRCKFNREVIEAVWNESEALWTLTLRLPDQTVQHITANAIISAVGLFSTINKPVFPGIQDFKGHLFHTTQWDHSVNHEGMRIGVIGNGSSGAQLIPGLGKVAKHLTVFQRTPQWIAPYSDYRSPVPTEMHWLFNNMPYYRNWFLYAGFVRGMQLPPLQVADLDWQAKGGQVNERNDTMRKGLTSFIEAKVKGDPELMAKLVPKYAPLVRRLVVDNGFYDTIIQDNVDLVTEPIEKFVKDGIITKDGVHRQLDLVVLGCGFKPTSFLYPVEYRGRNGITLDQTWQKDGARSYLGLTIPGYPNLFTLYGPNHQPRGGPSLHSWSEIWGRYAISMIVWMIENQARAVDVKQTVYDSYQAEIDEAQLPLIWDGEGRGYFVNEHGRQAVNMPWTSDVYHARVLTPELGDYNVEY